MGNEAGTRWTTRRLRCGSKLAAGSDIVFEAFTALRTVTFAGAGTPAVVEEYPVEHVIFFRR